MEEIGTSNLIKTWASSGLSVEPDLSKIAEGWQLGEQPPHEWMNWLQNTFGQKINHILKNGVAIWNKETSYLVGSSVQYSGNVWLCKINNSNSIPTDANVNWKRIITIDALTTLLNGYVSTTGNQTIAGIKTFSSSPIVPTPTATTQAANKQYVDTVAGDSTIYNNGLGKQGYTHTANATFTSTDNKIIMTGIVSALGLEVGDVITFSNANASNNKPHTVESITNDNEIIVNYEHCGSRGNGSLKLVDETVTLANCKLLAKWFVAPIGLGQDWVKLTSIYSDNVNYNNNTSRTIAVNLRGNRGSGSGVVGGVIYVNGEAVSNNRIENTTSNASRLEAKCEVTANAEYSFEYSGINYFFYEMR